MPSAESATSLPGEQRGYFIFHLPGDALGVYGNSHFHSAKKTCSDYQSVTMPAGPLNCWCGKRFAAVLHLQQHITDTGQRYACTCGELLANADSAKKHLKNVPHPLYSSCIGCAALDSPAEYITLASALGPDGVDCDYCGKEFSSALDAEQHTVAKHPVCPTCGLVFEQRELLRNHQKIASHCGCLAHNLIFDSAMSQDLHWRSVHGTQMASAKPAATGHQQKNSNNNKTKPQLAKQPEPAAVRDSGIESSAKRSVAAVDNPIHAIKNKPKQGNSSSAGVGDDAISAITAFLDEQTQKILQLAEAKVAQKTNAAPLTSLQSAIASLNLSSADAATAKTPTPKTPRLTEQVPTIEPASAREKTDVLAPFTYQEYSKTHPFGGNATQAYKFTFPIMTPLAETAPRATPRTEKQRACTIPPTFAPPHHQQEGGQENEEARKEVEEDLVKRMKQLKVTSHPVTDHQATTRQKNAHQPAPNQTASHQTTPHQAAPKPKGLADSIYARPG